MPKLKASKFVRPVVGPLTERDHFPLFSNQKPPCHMLAQGPYTNSARIGIVHAARYWRLHGFSSSEEGALSKNSKVRTTIIEIQEVGNLNIGEELAQSRTPSTARTTNILNTLQYGL